jgi:hypothetical protein
MTGEASEFAGHSMCTDAEKIGVTGMEISMWNKATEHVRFEILRVQSHFEIERLIDRATENGFSAEEAIDALEQALEAMRSYRATRAKYPKTPRLF